MTFNIGTPTYASPEQLTKNIYNQKTDVYSLGIVYYEMLNCFDTHMERHINITKLRNLDEELFNEFKKKYPDESILIKQMLDKNIETRLNIKTVKQQFKNLKIAHKIKYSE